MPALPTRIGRYDVRDRLGEGGMGIVYLATDPKLERTVAIKILSAVSSDQANDELRERFAREARSVAALKHNHIVTIYDIGEDQGRPFIAMEFLDGETLGEMIRRRAPLTISRKLQLMGELCAGLGYAHRHGIVHRDIKPANLMITSEGTLKILDFGLARLTADLTSTGLTRHGALMGTPFYMSPEQVDGTPVDPRSDIFAVGAVLYELLTYRKAFPGDSSHVVLHNIMHRQPTPIRQLVPDLDPELEDVINRSLDKDRALRYQNLAVVASDLERIRGRLRQGPDASPPGVPAARDVPSRLEGSGGRTPRPVPTNLPNLGAIAERRAAQIELHLSAAARHLENRQFDEVIEQCEHALVLNPQEQRALDMLSSAHQGLEDARIAGWLEQARGEFSQDALTKAESLVEQSLELRPDHIAALELRHQIHARRRERERAAERNRALQLAVHRAHANLEAGALEAAVRSVSEALAYDPDHAEAHALKQEIEAAIEERRREQAHEQAAYAALANARRLADADDFDGALATLRAFDPPHDLVTEAISDFEAKRVAFHRRREEAERRRAEEERRRREEEDRRRREEEARRRQEEERLAREQEASRQREEERRRQDEQRRREDERRRRDDEVALCCRRVRVALEQGRVGEADAWVEKARALAPDDPQVRELMDAVDAARQVAAAATYRRQEVARLLAEARDRLQGGEISSALSLVRSALELDPHDSAARSLESQANEALARSRVPRPEPDAEEEDLERTVDNELKKQEEAAALVSQAMALWEDGARDDAIELLRSAPLVHPDITAALETLERLNARHLRHERRKASLARLRGLTARRVLVPAGAAIALAIGIVAYLNLRPTSHPLVSPVRVRLALQPPTTATIVNVSGGSAPEGSQSTPVDLSLEPGRYRVTANNPGTGADYVFEFEVAAGAANFSVAHSMPVAVSVDLLPWANVTIVGTSAPKTTLVTPFTIELLPGKYQIAAENGGLTPPASFDLDVRPGGPATLRELMPGFRPDDVVNRLLRQSR